MSLGNQIQLFRKKNSLSQEQLAEMVGVARQTISKWENNETSPDIKQAAMLAHIFGVTLDELLGEAVCSPVGNAQPGNARGAVGAQAYSASAENPHTDQAPPVENTLPHGNPSQVYSPQPDYALVGAKRAYSAGPAVIVLVIVCLCLIIVGALVAVRRIGILYPLGIQNTAEVTRQNPISIRTDADETTVFDVDGKPAIVCGLPEGFEPDSDVTGLFKSADGSFIMFDSDYEENISNPLLGSEYYMYYEKLGLDSYMEAVRYAMYCDIPPFGILSSKEELYYVGGAQLIRQQFLAGNSADYYEIGGELTGNGEKMLILGFALDFGEGSWLALLKDYENNYYYITLKAPDGIGSSPKALGDFIGSIYAGNARQYAKSKDSVALQTARNVFLEYYAEYLANNGEIGGMGNMIYSYNNIRYVAFAGDGSTVGVYGSLEAALSALGLQSENVRLSETFMDGLFKCE